MEHPYRTRRVIAKYLEAAAVQDELAQRLRADGAEKAASRADSRAQKARERADKALRQLSHEGSRWTESDRGPATQRPTQEDASSRMTVTVRLGRLVLGFEHLLTALVRLLFTQLPVRLRLLLKRARKPTLECCEQVHLLQIPISVPR